MTDWLAKHMESSCKFKLYDISLEKEQITNIENIFKVISMTENKCFTDI